MVSELTFAVAVSCCVVVVLASDTCHVKRGYYRTPNGRLPHHLALVNLKIDSGILHH